MAKKIIARSQFENDYIDPGIACDPSESKTQQSAAQECDINYIMQRYEKTGILPDLIKADPRYGDFSAVPDYQKAMEIVAHAEEQFAALDAPIRRRFNDDPANFLGFCEDPQNVDELVKLGLATRRDPSPGGSVPVAGSPSAGTGAANSEAPGGQAPNQALKPPGGN